jgi:four helix bundle protein
MVVKKQMSLNTNTMYKDFTEMPVWKTAMDFAVDIFQLTEALPRKEDYGLTSQLRRASLSISNNIAESFGREHTKDKLNFYFYSRGSLLESKNELIYGQRVGYFNAATVEQKTIQIYQMHESLNKIIKTLRERG